MVLNIQAEVKEIQEYYNKDPRQRTFNFLLLGESGTGKSFTLRTCRKPVHVDSFDPGGTKNLREWIEKGEIIADTRWESEEPLSPSEFKKWKRSFEHRRRDSYFDYMGTYALDSATTWAESIMNAVLKESGIAGEPPRFTKDYTPQKTQIRNQIYKMLSLPCDFILTGHLRAIEDPDKGTIFRFMTTGQGMVTIPLLFDEIYVLDTKESSSGTEYMLLTQRTKFHLGRSRLAADGKLNKIEEPNIKKLLKKVGLPSEDKPSLW